MLTQEYVVLTRNGRRLATIYLGGRYAREATFEGKIDEVAVYDRPLTPAEIVEHFRAAGEQFVHPDHW